LEQGKISLQSYSTEEGDIQDNTTIYKIRGWNTAQRRAEARSDSHPARVTYRSVRPPAVWPSAIVVTNRYSENDAFSGKPKLQPCPRLYRHIKTAYNIFSLTAHCLRHRALVQHPPPIRLLDSQRRGCSKLNCRSSRAIRLLTLLAALRRDGAGAGLRLPVSLLVGQRVMRLHATASDHLPGMSAQLSRAPARRGQSHPPCPESLMSIGVTCLSTRRPAMASQRRFLGALDLGRHVLPRLAAKPHGSQRRHSARLRRHRGPRQCEILAGLARQESEPAPISEMPRCKRRLMFRAFCSPKPVGDVHHHRKFSRENDALAATQIQLSMLMRVFFNAPHPGCSSR